MCASYLQKLANGADEEAEEQHAYSKFSGVNDSMMHLWAPAHAQVSEQVLATAPSCRGSKECAHQ